MTRCYYHKPEMELRAARRAVAEAEYAVGRDEARCRRVGVTPDEWLAKRLRLARVSLCDARHKADTEGIHCRVCLPYRVSYNCCLVAITPSGFVIVRRLGIGQGVFMPDGTGGLRIVYDGLRLGEARLEILSDLPPGVQLPTAPLWYPSW